jgi:hypothetical protein
VVGCDRSGLVTHCVTGGGWANAVNGRSAGGYSLHVTVGSGRGQSFYVQVRVDTGASQTGLMATVRIV